MKAAISFCSSILYFLLESFNGLTHPMRDTEEHKKGPSDGPRFHKVPRLGR